MTVRRTTVVLCAIAAVATPSHAGDIGAGAMSRCASMGGGSMGCGAALSPPGAAVIGIVWPFVPDMLWEAAKETSFADLDPVTTPTNFGVGSDVVVTQGTGSAKPTYRDPCPVGPAIPCFYLDGGDSWQDATARASTKPLHDGTGATCYFVGEMVAATAADSTWLATGAWATTEVGALYEYSAGATDRMRIYVANGSAQIINGIPTGGTWGDDATRGVVVVHGTARTNDADVQWRGAVVGASGGNVDYGAAVSASNPAYGVSIGKRAGGGAGGQMTGYIFAIACKWAIHDAAMITATWDAVEAATGALPQ